MSCEESSGLRRGAGSEEALRGLCGGRTPRPGTGRAESGPHDPVEPLMAAPARSPRSPAPSAPPRPPLRMRRGTSGPPGGAAAPRPRFPPAATAATTARPGRAGAMGKKHKKHKSDKHPYDGGWAGGGGGGRQGTRGRARRVRGLGPRPGRARRPWGAGRGAAGPQPGWAACARLGARRARGGLCGCGSPGEPPGGGKAQPVLLSGWSEGVFGATHVPYFSAVLRICRKAPEAGAESWRK